MSTMQILEGALGRLRRFGWCQDRAIDGERMCLVEALAFGAGAVHKDEAGQWHRDWDMVLADVSPQAHAAASIVATLIGTRSGRDWNNAPERTFADIEALLTAAIAIAKEQEDQQGDLIPASISLDEDVLSLS